MSRVLTAPQALGVGVTHNFFASDQFVAVSLAVLFHLIVIALLLASKQEMDPVADKVNSIKVQIMMQSPAEPAAVVEPMPVEVIPEPPAVEVPKPVKKEQPVAEIKEAKLAKKRVDEQPVLLKDTNPEPVKEIEKTPSEAVSAKAAAAATQSTNKKAELTDAVDSTSSPEANFDTSQYLPVQKDAPAYPKRALTKGVQGECTVRYTVNTEGRVENSEALSDCHPFFIKPSLEATKSFKYTPRMVDGVAVKVLNVKNSFQYRIE